MVNVGQTPALAVKHHVKAVPRAQGTFHADVQQARLAESVKAGPEDRSGNVIFAKSGISRGITFGPDPDEVRAALASHKTPAFKRVMLYVVGSVSYRFPFKDELHQTGFIYDVMVMDGTSEIPSRWIDLAGGEIPAERLVLNTPDDESPYVD